MGMVPPSTPATPWYWTCLDKFIARQSKLWPGGGWSSQFQTMCCCAVFSTATNPWGGRGRGIIGEKKYLLITCLLQTQEQHELGRTCDHTGPSPQKHLYQTWEIHNLKYKQAGVELGLTQAETVSLELGLIKGLTKISWSCAGVNLTIKARFNSGWIMTQRYLLR